MGVIRTIGAVIATKGTPTPVYTGPVIAAISASISKGIATIVLGPTNFPAIGYNPPDPGLTGSNSPAGGQQVTLWGFSTFTYFNGKNVTVYRNNPQAGSFSFFFNHADVSSTADTGNTAAVPFEHFRVVRLECSQSLGGDIIYVGDGNVSSTQYMAALSLTGQLAIEIAGENVPAERIFIDTSGTSMNDAVMVSTIY